MTNQMPERIYAHEVSNSTVYMSGASPVNALTRAVTHPRLGEPTEYIRADLLSPYLEYTWEDVAMLVQLNKVLKIENDVLKRDIDEAHDIIREQGELL